MTESKPNTHALEHLGQILPVQGIGRGRQRVEEAEEVGEGHHPQVVLRDLWWGGWVFDT